MTTWTRTVRNADLPGKRTDQPVEAAAAPAPRSGDVTAEETAWLTLRSDLALRWIGRVELGGIGGGLRNHADSTLTLPSPSEREREVLALAGALPGAGGYPPAEPGAEGWGRSLPGVLAGAGALPGGFELDLWDGAAWVYLEVERWRQAKVRVGQSWREWGMGEAGACWAASLRVCVREGEPSQVSQQRGWHELAGWDSLGGRLWSAARAFGLSREGAEFEVTAGGGRKDWLVQLRRPGEAKSFLSLRLQGDDAEPVDKTGRQAAEFVTGRRRVLAEAEGVPRDFAWTWRGRHGALVRGEATVEGIAGFAGGSGIGLIQVDGGEVLVGRPGCLTGHAWRRLNAKSLG
ncbi:MAG: hypothetical protein IT443_04480 [Phycisphaeraceae bacterium]|nr:hypothetical protein [Phycisphaeraceae bacterium]